MYRRNPNMRTHFEGIAISCPQPEFRSFSRATNRIKVRRILFVRNALLVSYHRYQVQRKRFMATAATPNTTDRCEYPNRSFIFILEATVPLYFMRPKL